MDSDLNDRMAMCRTSIACIRSMLRSRPNDWQSYVSHARFVMATIDTVPFSADPADLDQRTWMIEGLQKLAYHETDNGSFSDIADWCMRHWLVVLQHQPENVTTLRGRLSEFSISRSSTYVVTVIVRTRSGLDTEGSPIPREDSAGGKKYIQRFQPTSQWEWRLHS